MSKINIPILMYHSIERMPKDTVMRSLHVPPKRFEFQMKLLKFLGYKGLSINKLLPYLNGEKHGKVVGITFDDGYENNLINAAPILKKYNFSATCYIVSSRIGSSNIWDNDRGITQRPLMSKNQIVQWINLGMDVGAHTRTHCDLTKLHKNEIIEEINCSKSELEDYFEIFVNDFCYPYGYFNKQVSSLVEDAGFKTATTMIRGKMNKEHNLFMMPRIPINHHTLPHLFLAKILTKYEEKKS